MTISVLTIVVVVLMLAAGLFVLHATPAIRAYFDYRGKRLIKCPETHTTEAVEVAAGEAAVGAFLNEPTLHLRQCSRWPEREHCGQQCLQQIEIDPENCLVWNIVSKWYEGKACVFCHKQFGPLHHLDHVPALLTPDHETIEWKCIRPQQLPEVLETHRPVCWNCHVAETFRRLHPELVVDRELELKRAR
ncbi:MAG TPA: hypothetical protein VMD99_01480 [Terriglobales bacterium]|nr:hypothetical protein [Terriglobales bacterium]